jgi:hypothetical protein
MQGEVYDVVEYGNGWVYLSVDAGMNGWVSMDYVTVDVDFETALTMEEEAARLAEERRLAAAAAAATTTSTTTSSTTTVLGTLCRYCRQAALRQAVVN